MEQIIINLPEGITKEKIFLEIATANGYSETVETFIPHQETFDKLEDAESAISEWKAKRWVPNSISEEEMDCEEGDDGAKAVERTVLKDGEETTETVFEKHVFVIRGKKIEVSKNTSSPQDFAKSIISTEVSKIFSRSILKNSEKKVMAGIEQIGRPTID